MAGKLSVMFELEMPEARAAGAKAGRDFVSGFGDALKQASASFKALNPHLFQGIIRPPGEAHGPQGIQKTLAMGELFPKFIKGLRDVTGADLAKVQAMGMLSAGKMNWGQLLLGAAVAPFSPWIGARGIAGGLSGGGNGGGVGNALFGGGFGKFEAAFLGIQIASKVFEHAVDMFKGIVEEGFHLYTRAAQTSRTVGQLFSTEQAAKQVGVSPDQIDQFLNRNNWGRARNSLQNFGVQRQTTSLAEDYQAAYKWAQEIQGTWEMNSRKMYDIQVSIDRIKTDWMTIWNDSGFITGIDKLLKWTDSVLHGMNATEMEIQKGKYIEQRARDSGFYEIPTRSGFTFSRTGDKSGAVSEELRKKMMAIFEGEWSKKTGGGQLPLTAGGFQMPLHGAWEKMGLVLGSHKADSKELEALREHTTYLKQIAAQGRKMLQPSTSGSARFSPA